MSSTNKKLFPSSPTKSPSSPTKSPSSPTKSPSSNKNLSILEKNFTSKDDDIKIITKSSVDEFILSQFDKTGLPKLITDLQHKMEKIKKVTIPDYKKNITFSDFFKQINTYLNLITKIQEEKIVKKDSTVKLLEEINDKLISFNKKYAYNLAIYLVFKKHLQNKTFIYKNYSPIDEKDLNDFYHLIFESKDLDLENEIELYVSNSTTKKETFCGLYDFDTYLKPRTVWKAIVSPKFQIWKQRMAQQKHISINSISITDIDMFGPTNVGFIKFKTYYIDNRNEFKKSDNGVNIQQGIVFMRGDSVAILVLLHEVDKKKKINQVHVILTCQNRIPAGDENFVELVAGMVDSSTHNLIDVAAKEVEEETSIKINIDEAIDLGMMAPSVGGCDERIHMYAFVQKVTSQQIEEFQGKLTGNLEEGESITLKVVKYEEVMLHTYDAKAMCAMYKYEQYLRSQEEKEEQTQYDLEDILSMDIKNVIKELKKYTDTEYDKTKIDEILFDYIDFLKENNLLNKNTLKDLNNVYTDKKIFKKLLKKQLTSDPTEFKEKYVEFLDK